MHDLIHDLARATSTGEFLTINRTNMCNASIEARHAHIKESALHCQFSKPNLLRTLISKINSRVCEQDLKNPNLNIHEAIRLRILIFPYYVSSLGSFPSLKHLRYLAWYCPLQSENASLINFYSI